MSGRENEPVASGATARNAGRMLRKLDSTKLREFRQALADADFTDEAQAATLLRLATAVDAFERAVQQRQDRS